MQDPHDPVVQLPVLLSQDTVLVLVPQLPQLSLATGLLAAGQVCPVQGPHSPQEPPSQLALQLLVCVPLFPQERLVVWVWVGAKQVPLWSQPKRQSQLQVS